MTTLGILNLLLLFNNSCICNMRIIISCVVIKPYLIAGSFSYFCKFCSSSSSNNNNVHHSRYVSPVLQTLVTNLSILH